MIFIAKGTVLVASPQNFLRIGRESPSRSAPQRSSPEQGAEVASTRGLSFFQEYVLRESLSDPPLRRKFGLLLRGADMHSMDKSGEVVSIYGFWEWGYTDLR